MYSQLRLRMTTLVLLSALVVGILVPAVPTAAAAPTQPNILFILTDDLDLAEIAYMPKLKALLIDQGTSFSNYFVSVSLCCPSRSTTIRGQYSHNTGVETNGGGNGGFETAYKLGIENSTIATWLQSDGYKTGLFGKYLNGYPNTAGSTYIPPGWSEWNSSVKGNPYSEFNYTLNSDGKLTAYKHKPKDYGTDVYAQETNDFIQQSVKDQKPFFAYLAVYAPHQPATPAPRDADLFPGAQAPHTPNYNEADVTGKPAFIADLPLMKPAVQQRVDTLYRKRIQSLQAVDDAIDSIYNTLKANGQLDNTYIIFTSDNGFHLGNHRMPAGKQTAYEEDIHLPLIVRGPGIAAGKTIDGITGNIDLAPTMASMAGVTPPDFVDGRSFLPLLLAQNSAAWRTVYLVEHFNQSSAPAAQAAPDPDTQEPADIDQSPDQAVDIVATATPSPNKAPVRGIPEFHGIRGEGYVYVEYETGEKEFYDLTKDPYELHNLAAKLDPATLKALSDRVSALVICKADACRAAENQPLALKMPVSS
ncbi:MAG: sulfatase [Chloroflexota bacterium]